ncbi:MAG: O-antigen ligase family protein [Myxococcota bacterium]
MIYTATRWILAFVGVSLALTEVVAFDLGFLIFSLNKVATAVLLGWAAFFWLATRRGYPRDRKAPWVVALGTAFLLSVILTWFKGTGLDQVIVALIALGSVILFYFLLVYVTIDFRSVDSLLVGFLVGVSISSLSVLLGSQGGAEDRTGGLGGDPNHFSYEAAVGIAVALMYFTRTHSKWIQTLLAGFFLLALMGIMASLSRSGALAAGLVIVLWMIRFRAYRFLPALVAAGVLGGFVMFFATPRWSERMGTLANVGSADADASVRTRMAVNEYAARAFVNNPIFGVGYLYFGRWGVDRIRELRQTGQADVLAGTETVFVRSRVAIHNSYLHVAAEMGLLGLIPYLIFLGLAWSDYSRTWKTAKRFPADPLISKIYLAATFLQIGLAAGLVDNLFLSSLRFKSLWVLLALSTVLQHLLRARLAELSRDPAAPGRGTSGPTFGAGPAAGLPLGPPLRR